jgi:hypothetical protein
MHATHEMIELLLDEKRSDPGPESGSAASGMVFENSADEDKMDRFKDRIIEQDDASDKNLENKTPLPRPAGPSNK